jgi:uncharacterized repeat protein (TIGR03803 family)
LRLWSVFFLFGLSAANLSGQIGILHSFTGGASDGANPYGSLVLLGSSLYGMTPNGGAPDLGTVFKIHTDGTGFALLHVFTGGAGDGRMVTRAFIVRLLNKHGDGEKTTKDGKNIIIKKEPIERIRK